ncbi:MAG: FHA domain-containing protein [Bryobacterales bacterium]|nr:FHA domain-containing protein [Bryobacterales bacterium]
MYALQITEGPRKGEVFYLRDGESVTIGRQRSAGIALSGDATLSGTHCSVSARKSVVCVTDEGSSNGTYVEGVRIQAQRLQPGQRFRAGQTEVLLVYYPSFGSWMIPAIPPGWSELPGSGIQIAQTGRFPTNILFTEEALGTDETLPRYIRLQQLGAREALPRVEFQVPMPVAAFGVEEAYVTRNLFEAAGGVRATQRQFFVRKSGLAGVVSMTTIESEVIHVERMFDAVVAKARFVPKDCQR